MSNRILVVDDNAANRRLLSFSLKPLGYIVTEATNGIEGLRMAREEKPDLILMDRQLPFMDGYEVIKSLRNDPDTRNIKIIAVTSSAMKGDREKALEAGADEYVPKPIDTRRLPETITRLLG